MLDNKAGESEQRNGVGDDHEVVEHVAQLPDEVVGHHRAEEDEHEREDGVDHGALLAEEVGDVDLAEEVPAQDRGEGEEEQADGDEHVARTLAEDDAERGLGEVSLAEHAGDVTDIAARERAVRRVKGGDDDERVERQDDEGVDEHADHGDDALVVRAVNIREGVGVRGGAHTGLVGEQAALGTLRNRGLDGVAEAAADDGLGLEGILEDHADGGGDVLDADDQDDQAAEQEDSRHDGDDLLRDGGEALYAAKEDERADRDEDDTDDPGGNAEGGLHRGADGVGLHHAAEEAECQRDGDGEEAGEELAEAALKGRRDVVDRTALDVAVLFDDAGLLGERRFRVDRGHAEEGDDPHPEDGAGAAGQDRAGRADDVARTDLSGDGGGERLERAHAAVMLLAAQRQVAEHAVPALFEAAQLHEAGLDGVPQAHAEQQEHENVVAQVGVDVAYNGIQGAFDGFKHGYLSPLKTKEVADTKISNSGSSIQLSGEEKRCDDVKTSCFSVPLPERFGHHGLAPSALNSMSSPEFPRLPVCEIPKASSVDIRLFQQ